MLGWAIDDQPAQLWLPHEQPKPPAELREAVRDPDVLKLAWNAPFEQAIFEHTLGTRTANWRDVMVMAHYASLPGKLEFAGKAMGLPEDKQKLADGKRLIRKFCQPRKPTKNKPYEWADHTTDSEDWQTFCDYCVRDVDSEREIAHRLKNFAVPGFEWSLWDLDQEINRRGMPVDLQLVENAIEMGAVEKARLKRELMKITGLDDITNAKFLRWAQEEAGYPFGDLQKATVQRALAIDDLDHSLRVALNLRAEFTKTSIAKYDALKLAAPNGRAHHLFQFYGASRTGRWAGRKVQAHNLPRATKEVAERLHEATDLVRNGEYEETYMEFGNVMHVLSSLIRSAFRAPPGRVLRVADLNAIENRVLGWLAGCKAILDVFVNGLDPYMAFGVHLYSKPYEKITKEERTNSKPAVLGAGYRLGGGELKENDSGDLVRTGLWGYAEQLGVDMPREMAHRAVAIFRQTYPEVVQFWYELEDAARRAVTQQETVRVGFVVFDMKPGVMRIKLPSGRYLHYLKPRYRTITFEGRDGPYKKQVLTYEGINQKTKQWGRQTTHGGKITENLCQAIARDLLAAGLVRANGAGFEIVGHVHDEIIAECDANDNVHTVELLCDLMSRPLKWAPGLPLAAAGYENQFFKKD